MTILQDSRISWYAKQGMIEPFVNDNVREVDGKKKLSYGLSSAGYDVRCGEVFKVFKPTSPAGHFYPVNREQGIIDVSLLQQMTAFKNIIDPKNFDSDLLETLEVTEDYVILPSRSSALTSTVEYFKIPRDIAVMCVGKSTYARCGILINATPIEPGFGGNVVIEVINTTPLPVKVYINEGIAQFIFYKMDGECNVSYADRGGKYQGQTGIQEAKI